MDVCRVSRGLNPDPISCARPEECPLFTRGLRLLVVGILFHIYFIKDAVEKGKLEGLTQAQKAQHGQPCFLLVSSMLAYFHDLLN